MYCKPSMLLAKHYISKIIVKLNADANAKDFSIWNSIIITGIICHGHCVILCYYMSYSILMERCLSYVILSSVNWWTFDMAINNGLWEINYIQIYWLRIMVKCDYLRKHSFYYDGIEWCLMNNCIVCTHFVRCGVN